MCSAVRVFRPIVMSELTLFFKHAARVIMNYESRQIKTVSGLLRRQQLPD